MIESDLAVRRRRIRFRAWHRGLREVDLLLGGFADAQIEALDDGEIVAFEALLDVPDQTVLDWLMGTEPLDARHDTAFWRKLAAFTAGDRKA